MKFQIIESPLVWLDEPLTIILKTHLMYSHENDIKQNCLYKIEYFQKLLCPVVQYHCSERLKVDTIFIYSFSDTLLL